MAYGDFKDLKRRTASDKILRDKAFNIAKIPKHDGYQRGLASIVYKFFNNNSTGSGVNIPPEFDKKLVEELHKQIIKNFKKEPFIQDLKIIFGCWFGWYAINKQV